MTTWADVAKGDRVELGGKAFVVTKLKAKGKRAVVVVVGGGGRFESEVKLADTVKLAPAKGKRSAGKESADWYEPKGKAERKELKLATLPAGDPSVTKRPAKPSGDPWETPRDKTERMLERLLGAHLVAETLDEALGYYVPPVDASTVRAHLMLLHGAQPSDWDDDVTDAALLAGHEAQHADALADPTGSPLAVNHWHTETRPKR